MKECKDFTVTTYCLKDSDGIVFYVGATAVGTKTRLYRHIYSAKNNLYKNSNIQNIMHIIKHDYKISIHELDSKSYTAISSSQAIFMNGSTEKFWVTHYESLGVKLFNIFLNKRNLELMEKYNTKPTLMIVRVVDEESKKKIKKLEKELLKAQVKNI